MQEDGSDRGSRSSHHGNIRNTRKRKHSTSLGGPRLICWRNNVSTLYLFFYYFFNPSFKINVCRTKADDISDTRGQTWPMRKKVGPKNWSQHVSVSNFMPTPPKDVAKWKKGVTTWSNQWVGPLATISRVIKGPKATIQKMDHLHKYMGHKWANPNNTQAANGSITQIHGH